GNALLAEVRESGSIVNADTDLKLNKPQLAVDIDRDKAAAVGVDIETIGRTLETLLGGRQVTRFKREGKQYDVVVQLEARDRNTPADLTAIYVRAKDGRLVQLSNLVSVRETVAAKELNHFDRQRAVILSANVAPGHSLGDALAFLEAAADKVLPKSARTTLDGQSREFRESGATLAFTFALALVFIYLVLAALGALVTLWLTGNSINVYSQIGLVMLIGLITKNGILIVEFANQLRARGMGKLEAVVESSTLRLRPILMTSLATVLGATPLALAAGAGSEARQAIGWVVVGGLSVGTLFTLFVIPTAYTLLAREGGPAQAAAGGAMEAKQA
ncbi:MAG: efflux RND transporter permease subunit, partial [Burkholderiales bacterium]|nr:efflux RND transporter permease subunit [Burkholderiales bacterium]